MKKLSFIMLLLSITLIGTHCSEEENVKKDNTTHDVPFKFNIDGVDQTVIATFKYNADLQRLVEISGNVTEIEATDETTGKLMYVYTYTLNALEHANERAQWSIKTGYYGYSSGCFYWGTLITGDSGSEHFSPHSAAYNPPICPGGEWAYEWQPRFPECSGECE
jgi:hypothetical protein